MTEERLNSALNSNQYQTQISCSLWNISRYVAKIMIHFRNCTHQVSYIKWVHIDVIIHSNSQLKSPGMDKAVSALVSFSRFCCSPSCCCCSPGGSVKVETRVESKRGGTHCTLPEMSSGPETSTQVSVCVLCGEMFDPCNKRHRNDLRLWFLAPMKAKTCPSSSDNSRWAPRLRLFKKDPWHLHNRNMTVTKSITSCILSSQKPHVSWYLEWFLLLYQHFSKFLCK